MAISNERLDDLESSTWEQRIGRGKECENNFAGYLLKQHGLHAIEQSPMIRDTEEVRHFLDIGILELPNTYWQVADGRRSHLHDGNVIKEQASYRGAVLAAKNGRQVYIVWEMPDGRFRGNRVDNLEVIGQLSKESRSHGSGTRGYVFIASCLVDLDELLEL